MIAAQQYYIEFGNAFDPERLFSLLPNYIPDYCLQVKDFYDFSKKFCYRTRRVSVCSNNKLRFFSKSTNERLFDLSCAVPKNIPKTY